MLATFGWPGPGSAGAAPPAGTAAERGAEALRGVKAPLEEKPG